VTVPPSAVFLHATGDVDIDLVFTLEPSTGAPIGAATGRASGECDPMYVLVIGDPSTLQDNENVPMWWVPLEN
jgi:hypothetical protein